MTSAAPLEIKIWPIDRLILYARNPRKNDAVVDRSHNSLAAGNLFVRKQRALFQERKVNPRRVDDATRWRRWAACSSGVMRLSFAKNASAGIALPCNAFITVMQASEVWNLDDPSDGL